MNYELHIIGKDLLAVHFYLAKYHKAHENSRKGFNHIEQKKKKKT
jgi:hypothetical protein